MTSVQAFVSLLSAQSQPAVSAKRVELEVKYRAAPTQSGSDPGGYRTLGPDCLRWNGCVDV